jgi:hypothetical protein
MRKLGSASADTLEQGHREVTRELVRTRLHEVFRDDRPEEGASWNRRIMWPQLAGIDPRAQVVDEEPLALLHDVRKGRGDDRLPS